MRAELQCVIADIEETANAKRAWTNRHAVFLYLTDDDGHLGAGEASPLPGLSPDTASECHSALVNMRWPQTPPQTWAEIREVVQAIPRRLPAARFAAESALGSLAAAIRGVPMHALWEEEVSALPVALGLFAADGFGVRRLAREAAVRGAQAVKVKVGTLPQNVEDELLRDVRSIVGDVELRLDANGCLDTEDLPRALERFAELNVSFLEEPCALEHIEALSDVPFPLAVDESLAPDPERRLERALACPHVGAIVLKPTLLGGLARCHRLARVAREAGRRVVVSHLLEGCIARAAHGHLALAIAASGPPPHDAAGLGVHAALAPLSGGVRVGWIDGAWIEVPAQPGLGLELAW